MYMTKEIFDIWMVIAKEIQIWRLLDSDIGMWFFVNENKIFEQTRLKKVR